MVKYPRGARVDDEIVLRTEAIYYSLAKLAGLYTGQSLDFVDKGRGALFIPRFDRVVTSSHSIVRMGMWSFSSATGSYRFGEKRYHEDYCNTIATHATFPSHDIFEYIKRDVLNIVLGNSDNHGRNSAFLRYPNGEIKISPLYDFAPMFIDPEGIPRATRWKFENPGRTIDWNRVLEVARQMTGADLTEDFREFVDKIELLPAKMREYSVDERVYSRCSHQIEKLTRFIS